MTDNIPQFDATPVRVMNDAMGKPPAAFHYAKGATWLDSDGNADWQCVVVPGPARNTEIGKAAGKGEGYSAANFIWPSTDPRWRVVGTPRRILTISLYQSGGDAVKNCNVPARTRFSDYVGMACSNYSRVCGLGFQLVSGRADVMIFSRNNASIGALGRQWKGTPWVGVSHTMHGGGEWVGGHLVSTIQHEIGHVLDDLGWPHTHAPAREKRAIMNPNGHRLPFRYTGKGDYYVHDVAGFWYPEWMYLQRKFGDKILWYAE